MNKLNSDAKMNRTAENPATAHTLVRYWDFFMMTSNLPLNSNFVSKLKTRIEGTPKKKPPPYSAEGGTYPDKKETPPTPKTDKNRQNNTENQSNEKP